MASWWFYRGAAEETSTAFASFPGEMPALNPPRFVLEANFNLIQYNKMPWGRHFAVWNNRSCFVEDVVKFFDRLR
jgi:hypothetical protein